LRFALDARKRFDAWVPIAIGILGNVADIASATTPPGPMIRQSFHDLALGLCLVVLAFWYVSGFFD
jgi:hypothetical protein